MNCYECVLSTIKLNRELNELEERAKAFRVVKEELGITDLFDADAFEEAMLGRLVKSVISRAGELDNCGINISDILQVFHTAKPSLDNAELLCEQITDWTQKQ